MHLMSQDFEVAFALMEGDGWLLESLEPRHDETFTIKGARRLFEKQCAEFEGDEEHVLGMSIYGNGGVHRYAVMVPSGSVLFSRHHCRGIDAEERLQNAEDLGFELY